MRVIDPQLWIEAVLDVVDRFADPLIVLAVAARQKRFEAREHRSLGEPRRVAGQHHEPLATTVALRFAVAGVARVGGLPEVGAGRQFLSFRGGHFAFAHGDRAGGGDFFAAV